MNTEDKEQSLKNNYKNLFEGIIFLVQTNLMTGYSKLVPMEACISKQENNLLPVHRDKHKQQYHRLEWAT